MGWRRDRYQDLGEVFGRGDVDPEVREEIEHHLASRIEENVRGGMSREEAEAEARRRFGDQDRYRRETKAIEHGHRTAARRRERFGVAVQEARRAVRALVRTPTFTVAAILTLAIGIGGSTAIFTLVDAIALRPLAYPEAGRLVRIYHPVPKVGPGARWDISSAEFFHFRRNAHALAALGIARATRANLGQPGQATQVNAALVSASMLPLLGLKPVVGRLFTEADNTGGTNASARKLQNTGSVASDRARERYDVLLSERIWREQFGADSAVVGMPVRVEGNEARVAGVVSGTGLPGEAIDLWLPQPLDPTAEARNNHGEYAVARLADGVTLAQAESELKGLLARYTEVFPSAYTQAFMDRTGFTVQLVPLKADVVGDTGRVLWVLLAAVGLVLAIACFNIGNLFLVRVHARRREVAVRSVLGASRGQLAWHHLSESLVLSLVAGGMGVGFAWAGLRVFLGALPGGRDPRVAALLPRLAEVHVGWPSVAFALGVAVVAGLAFGLAPLFLSLRWSEVLRQAGRGVTPSRREARVRGGLVVAQIVLAVVLLAGAGLMVRTVERLRSVSPGFDPDGVLAVDLALPYARYRTYQESATFFDDLIRRIQALPGVARAAAGSSLPLEMGGDGCAILAAEAPAPDVETPCVPNAVVSPGYFATLGIRLVGREATWGEATTAHAGALLTDGLARRLWGDRDPLGLGVKVDGASRPPYFPVTGVVKGVHFAGLEERPGEVVFYPLQPVAGTWLWEPPHRMTLVIRSRGVAPASLEVSVERIVREMDPDAALAHVRTLSEVVARSTLRVRLVTVLLGLTALVALLLSGIGLYGVIAYLVGRRSSEIGIRIALGASVATVRRQVVLESTRLAGLGVVLGAVAAFGATRLLRAMLFGVEPGDPLVLGGAVTLLLAVAIVASLVPARRASRVDPAQVLREGGS
jgi:putative ABC transport system permease protein